MSQRLLGGSAYVGPSCRACGKVCYDGRKRARQAARKLHPGQTNVRAYECRYSQETKKPWHVGHLPKWVTRGEKTYEEGARQFNIGRPADGASGDVRPGDAR